MQQDHIDTTGVMSVGEINTRVQREAQVEADYRNAYVAGWTRAYERMILACEQRLAAARPYDDTRALSEMIVIARDEIKAVH